MLPAARSYGSFTTPSAPSTLAPNPAMPPSGTVPLAATEMLAWAAVFGVTRATLAVAATVTATFGRR